jgi:hypothetical protein
LSHRLTPEWLGLEPGRKLPTSPRLACILALLRIAVFNNDLVFDLRGFSCGALRLVRADPNYLY